MKRKISGGRCGGVLMARLWRVWASIRVLERRVGCSLVASEWCVIGYVRGERAERWVISVVGVRGVGCC